MAMTGLVKQYQGGMGHWIVRDGAGGRGRERERIYIFLLLSLPL